MPPPAAEQAMFVSSSDLQDHQNDYDWLDEHIDSVFRQIKEGLGYAWSAIDAIEQLNLIMSYALTRHDYKRWEDLLYDALLHAMELGDEEYQIQIWSYLGNCFFQLGRYKTASATFRKALRRDDLDTTLESQLLARIGMLRTKTIYETRDIDQFIDETLIAAQAIASYSLLGKLHYTLAVAYTHQAETRKALGHGQIALACWYRENNTVEKERVALALAEICRVATCFKQAARYLELVHPGAEDIYISGILHYHQGAVLLELNQLEAAQGYLERALQQFKTLDFPYMTGAAYHTLALVQTKLDDFDIARENIRRAIIIWQQMDHVFQQASGVYALGFLEERAGNLEDARKLYVRALELARDLAVTPLLTELRAELQDHLASLSA